MLSWSHPTRGRWARGHRPLFCTVLTLVVLLVTHGGAPAAALTGSAPCPDTRENLPMWCNKWLGGAGGVLMAGEWTTNWFTCVCNGVLSLKVYRSVYLSGSEQQSLVSVASPSSMVSSSSPSDSSSSSLFNNSQSSSSTHRGWSSSSRSPLTSSSSSGKASSLSSSVLANDMCEWDGFFSKYPDGMECLPITGMCPASCSEIPRYLCESQYTVSCQVRSNDTLLYTCVTCSGAAFTINTTGPNTCNRLLTPPLCDPQSDCSGHGCCTMSHGDSSSSSVSDVKCNCFENRTHGYYAGTNCGSCAPGYYVNSEGICKTRVQPGQVLLASIGKTWTMVSPNVAVLFLFVIFSMVRKLHASDRPFELTGLRRANLSSVQVARRRQQSLFHSKYIPMRPAKSRSFTNPHQPRTRGPPAY
ncbi:hypothetical protein GH5_04168 [Leishmania sp. Ghana 2012 LV757]|uniref:hypothetical protein n=1 Tax=Leishmania sp. Ghana 2012 LV757 TaxID=2803181 RepID=UPI001B603660|nr:hypothetical protein GH5_04168 [Leishmania sp. Ghana 2012 LV757]